MRTMDTTEAGLIARILAGEKELFHELIRPYERMVYVTVFAIVRNETDAEDSAQDAMVNAYRHLAKFRGESKFSTWLATIAMNEGRQKLRKLKRAKEDSLDERLKGEDQEIRPAPLRDWREIRVKVRGREGLWEAFGTAGAGWPGVDTQTLTF